MFCKVNSVSSYGGCPVYTISHQSLKVVGGCKNILTYPKNIVGGAGAGAWEGSACFHAQAS